jgi:hypothetical protein
MAEHTQYISEDELNDGNSPARPRVVRLTDKLCPMFADAFWRLAGGESFTWDLTPTTVPNPQYVPMQSEQASAQPQFLTILFFYADTPGVIPRTVIMSTADLAPYGWDQARVDQVVMQRIQELLGARSAQLEQQGDQTNGQAQRNRIIMPGCP